VSLLAGVVGLAVAIGVILAPHAIHKIEKGLDKTFSTESVEKILNARRDLSSALLRRPRIFGFFLLAISFLLLLSNLLLF
jgi:hypothetical protein